MNAEKAKWKLTQPAFFAPNKLEEGTVIYFSGEPGAHLEPLNQAAYDRMEQYYRDHPGATMRPIDQLLMTMEPAAEVVSLPERKTERALSIEEMSEGKAAKPQIIRSFADAQVAAGAPDVDDPEYGAPSARQLSAADQAALDEVQRGQEEAAAAKAREAEIKQPRGKPA